MFEKVSIKTVQTTEKRFCGDSISKALGHNLIIKDYQE